MKNLSHAHLCRLDDDPNKDTVSSWSRCVIGWISNTQTVLKLSSDRLMWLTCLFVFAQRPKFQCGSSLYMRIYVYDGVNIANPDKMGNWLPFLIIAQNQQTHDIVMCVVFFFLFVPKLDFTFSQLIQRQFDDSTLCTYERLFVNFKCTFICLGIFLHRYICIIFQNQQTNDRIKWLSSFKRPRNL